MDKPHNVYEVVKPLDVNSGAAIPWFGQKGMGTQHETFGTIEDLVKDGVLKKI